MTDSTLNLAPTIRNLEIKLERQEKAVEETKAHIAALKQLQTPKQK